MKFVSLKDDNLLKQNIMKKFLFILIGFLTAVQSPCVTAQELPSSIVTAQVVNDQGDPVEYATVQMRDHKDSTRFFGTITDENGKFELTVPHGDYSLRITFLGYQEYNQDLTVSAKTDLGKLEMSTSTVDLKEVVVTANLITREADRYVVNLGNTQLAIGRDAKEALMLAPGVWVSERGEISVNGRTGTRVMVNERLLHETGEELLAYLQALKAEDILKIEVIPYTGAEYDASTQSGIVKITLRKQREDGMEGSVSLRFQHALDTKGAWQLSPATNVNFRRKKLSLYTNFSVNRNLSINDHESNNRFENMDASNVTRSEQNMNSMIRHISTSEQLRIGGVYDISDKHSIGLEVNYSNTPIISGYTTANMTIDDNGNHTDIVSLYSMELDRERLSVSGNYFLKLDTVGSMFKLLFDYNNYHNNNDNDYNSEYTGFMNFDTIYRNFIRNFSDLYTVNADFDIQVGKVSKIMTGIKYSFNNMHYDRLYEYFKQDLWNTISEQTGNDHYPENIGAIYFRYSTRFRNNFALALGLRGEYTYVNPTSSFGLMNEQNYFSLFPSFNLAMPLNEKQSQMLILNYNRKIYRPPFWALSPTTIPMSETMYQIGNPALKPTFTHDINISWVFGRKYSLNVGVQMQDGTIRQIYRRRGQSDIFELIFENMQRQNMWFINLALPFQITPWWGMTVNATGFNQRTVLNDGSKMFSTSAQANMNNTFTIAKKWYIDLSGYYQSRMESGNMVVDPLGMVNLSLKRSFLDNKLTASIFVNDIFNTGITTITAYNNGGEAVTIANNMTRVAGFSIRYNFKAGKQQKYKQVESGAKEETSRL